MKKYERIGRKARRRKRKTQIKQYHNSRTKMKWERCRYVARHTRVVTECCLFQLQKLLRMDKEQIRARNRSQDLYLKQRENDVSRNRMLAAEDEYYKK